MSKPTTSLVQAVMDADDRRVQELVAGGASLEEQDGTQQTPMLIAAKTDQFELAELLLDRGANIYAVSRFGWTVGYAAETSKLKGGPNAEARLRVMDKLKTAGFPFPAPHPTKVQDLVKQGEWPPRRH